MKKRAIARALGVAGFAAASLAGPAVAADAPTDIIRKNCLSCHTEQGGHFSRISDQRKTPEGWLMTIVRMQIMHGLRIDADDRAALVKYLADTQGLAPAETAGVRYAMERRLNTVESFESEQFTQMCARCHSGARVALQRRPEAEWAHLVHFHLGQFPSTEYSLMGRDRDWFDIALQQMVPELAATQPFESEAWKRWTAMPKSEPGGKWTMSGSMPGKGAFTGVMSVQPAGTRDTYSVSLQGKYDDGTPLSGEGQALVYTGFEWRGNLKVDGVAMRQVFALDRDMLSGRMFQTEHDEVGADIVAARQGSGIARVLAVHPAYVRAGEEATLTIVGANMEGALALPDGVKAVRVLERNPNRIVVKVRADADARGVHEVAVGEVSGGALALFDKVAAVKVVPEFSVSRIGGNGGSTPPVQGRFEAEAWAAGPDGVAGNEDDYRIGVMPASWSVEPFDDTAKNDNDVKFAGVMDAATGVFTPAGAGPNPERRQSTNNAGNLNVVATLSEGGETLTGKGQMIVTVQRWNNPALP